MIVEKILYFFVALTVVIAIFTLFNAVVYKKYGKIKWVKFISLSVLFIIAGLGLLYLVHYFVYLPYVNGFCRLIDNIFRAFLKYLPMFTLALWFIGPFVLVSLIIAGGTIIEKIQIKAKYRKWEKKNQPEVTTENEEDTISNTEEIQFYLDGAVLTEFKYESIFGLQKAYELSKAKGLQVSKIDNGFVAVYANKIGMNDLANLLNENNIPFEPLPNRPTLTVIHPDGATSVTVKESLEKLKGKISK